MNYKEFEKNVRNQLTGHEVPVDTNELVAHLFDKKQKVNVVPVWLLYIAVAVLAAGAIFYWLRIKDRPALHDSRPTRNAASVPGSERQSEIALLQENKQKAISGPAFSSGDVVLEVSDSKATVHTPSLNNGSMEPSDAYYSAKNSMGSGLLTGSDQGASPRAASFLGADPNHNQAVTQFKEGPTYVSGTSMEVHSSYFSDFLLAPVGLRRAEVISDLSSANNPFLPGVKCPSFKRKKKLSFSLIPEIGAFYPLTTFRNNSNPNSEVLEIRQREEKTLEGLQAALYGKISLRSSPWYIKTGINYGRITRRMTFDGSYIKRDTTIGIISITESETGDTVTVVRGPIVTETKVSKYERRHYYHHLWSIPMVIGYQKRFEKFVLGAEAGINFNLLSDQSGYVMTKPDEFGLVKDAGLYKQKMGISYLAQIQAGIPVNDNNILAVAIRANINPNNFAHTNVPLTEKYQMIGAHFMYELRF